MGKMDRWRVRHVADVSSTCEGVGKHGERESWGCMAWSQHGERGAWRMTSKQLWNNELSAAFIACGAMWSNNAQFWSSGLGGLDRALVRSY